MRAAAILGIGLAGCLAFAPSAVLAAKTGAPRLDAQALLVEGDKGPQVRVELQVRNVGSGPLRGCIGRAWGWRFPTLNEPGARVLAPPRDLKFELDPGEKFRWNENLSYAGPQAWIESVSFWVELLGPDCKGQPVARIESGPVMLVDSPEPAPP